MGQTAKLLQEAYDHIEDITRWAQGYYQYDERGAPCAIKDGKCFCSLGILNFISYRHEARDSVLPDTHPTLCALQRMSENMFGSCIQAVNDDPEVDRVRAHKNVLLIFRACIEKYKDRDPTHDDICHSGDLNATQNPLRCCDRHW